MRWLITTLILIVNLILQSTLFEYISIIGIKPNTALIIVVSIAFIRGETDGMLTGLIAGLLQDSFFGMFIGLHTFLYVMIGYLCGKFLGGFYKEGLVIPILVTILSTFCYNFGFYILSVLLRGYTNFIYFFNTIILPEMVYTAIFAVVLYKLIYFINRKLEAKEGYRSNLS